MRSSGRLRVASRLTQVVGLLGACLVRYYAALPFGRQGVVPRAFLAGLLPIIGGKLTVRGEVSPGRTFLLANHVSWIDILALAKATGTALIAHDGLAQSTPLRWLCRLNQTVFVARGDRQSVATQIRQVRDALNESRVLTIFPEGTTGDGTQLLPFKSSLLAAVSQAEGDVAVQPVWIDYGVDTRELAWVGQEPGLDNALRVLSRRKPFQVTVHLLPPLSGAELDDRKTIAAAARRAIEERAAASSLRQEGQAEAPR